MKIICVGRNYAAHAKELNSEVPQEPVLFMKPESAITQAKSYKIPRFTKNLHYETEIVLKINRFGHYIPQSEANSYFDNIALGIDFTARDIQNECIKKGLPWEKSKAFDDSAMVSKFIPKDKLGDINTLNFSLERDGEVVQQGNTKDMIFGFDELIANISQYFSLDAGDLIFTGTPVGVNYVSPEEKYQGFIEKELMLDFEIEK
ncbi:fumarylacetoacetate hydrolase family protein [Ornithobacterium rhinotracheale]|uniref:fumarylacetoacetate hydrolase family protein n=1 Tax=Ornithobacterium rhinotracheale TaxID=28251 RepID=UPI001FF1E3F2|nr:fumarylacetoacetate hydrolase family protein [Ornithobacterium rhinotracheale]MCK0201692.1 fumarylacetoacetate hydrolase family protein [Ornithobacterium rhinotracheale]